MQKYNSKFKTFNFLVVFLSFAFCLLTLVGKADAACNYPISGNYTLSTDGNCVQAYTIDGIDGGDFIVNSNTWTLAAGQTFVWSPGKRFLYTAGSVSAAVGSKMKQGYLFYPTFAGAAQGTTCASSTTPTYYAKPPSGLSGYAQRYAFTSISSTSPCSPGGSGVSITAATDLFGNIVWLNSGGFSAGTWTDSSGKSNNASGGTAPGSATRAELNGKSVVTFNGSTQYLSIADYAAGQEPVNGATVFIAGNHPSGGAASQALFSKVPSAGGWSSPYARELIQSGSSGDMTGYWQDASVATYQVAVHDYLRPFIVSLTGGPLGTAIYDNSIVNHTTGTKSTAVTITDSSQPTEIGRDPAPEYFQGDMAEVIVYQTALGAYDRLKVENYLAAKYKMDSTWTSTTISGLQAWYEADAGVYKDAGTTAAVDGDTVQQWNDQSGNARNLTQPTSGTRPTFKAQYINGKPAVYFSSKYLDTASWSQAQALTVFWVGRKTTNDSAQQWVFMNLASGAGAGYYNTTNGVYVYAPTGGSYTPGTAADIMRYTVYSGVINGASSQIWGNGASLGTGTSGSTGIGAGIRVGAAYDASGALDGYVSELMIYSGTLTASQRQQVEGYLANKYSTSAGIRPFEPTAAIGPVVTSDTTLRPAGLYGWWVVDNGTDTTTPDAAITTLYDRSGHGNNLTGSGTARPLYKTNRINGRATALFDGSNDVMNATFGISHPSTIFIVAKQVNNTGVANYWLDGQSATIHNGVYVAPGLVLTYDGNQTAQAGGTIDTTHFNVVTAGLWDAASKLYQDGITTSSGNPGNGTATGLNLGAALGGASGFANVEIAEVIAYQGQLTAQDTATIQAYLSQKYAIGFKAPNDSSLSSNLVLWLDPSQESYANNASVTTWTDRSSGGWNATTGTAPVFKTVTTNGRPVVNFAAASSQYLRNTSFSSLNGVAGATAFVVFKAASTGTGRMLVIQPNGRFPSMQRTNDNLLTTSVTDNDYGYASGFSDTGLRLYSSVFDGSGSGNAGRLKVWVGGVSQSLTFGGTIPATLSSSNGIYIGSTATPSSYWDGDIDEIIIYNTALSDADRRSVENYLGQKYNIAL